MVGSLSGADASSRVTEACEGRLTVELIFTLNI